MGSVYGDNAVCECGAAVEVQEVGGMEEMYFATKKYTWRHKNAFCDKKMHFATKDLTKIWGWNGTQE